MNMYIFSATVVAFLIISIVTSMVDEHKRLPVGFLLVILYFSTIIFAILDTTDKQKQKAIDAGVAEWKVTIDKNTGESTKEFKYLTNKPNELNKPNEPTR